ncbi:MAG: Fmu (Sun) domain-containing protein [Bacteroidetes bacterium]|nr:Fmu (Sun) domain-containing protein [Bacteroidota bacterium]MBS1974042.1 Fmu (Sun) domain-containing protein [Bacteroidota bacterium]
MKFESHLTTASEILYHYNGKEPFAYFIKKIFRQNKKYGATDRRTITHLCYCYFRLGHSLKAISLKEKILAGVFLCNQTPYELLAYFKPEWNAGIDLPLAKKIPMIHCPLAVQDIFPWKEQLSDGIDHENFFCSFLTQPDLFLRIRPGCREKILQKLSGAKVDFKLLDGSCVAMPNSTKLDHIIELNKEAVIQDYNSQQMASFFLSPGISCQPQTAWDCCAASGGKSIMLYDLFPGISLTVSDIRESVLLNLKKRFAEAGIKKYKAFVADLSGPGCRLPEPEYDLIIADVPCSGSGTWARTPESLSFFNSDAIEKYSLQQKKIISNTVPALKKNGALVYITCSVFRKENEEVAAFIKERFNMQLLTMKLLEGHHVKGDCMFAASFIKQ